MNGAGLPAFMVELEKVSFRAGDTRILDEVSCGFRQNRFNVIAGPNGAGKSTLMKIASGLLRPSSGVVKYGAAAISAFDPEALARTRAVLSQSVELAFGLSVEDVVLIGRFPHYGATPSRTDRDIVSEAIDAVGLGEKRRQAYPTLSGGEKQKVQLARVIAQLGGADDSTPGRILFLDEPVTGLDIHYQIHILDVARAMIARGCTVIAILHDLNVAFDYGDSVFILDKGRMAYETDDAATVRAELLESVFDVRASRAVDSAAGQFWRFSRRDRPVAER
jgi:iron complex transport system ATP-binding protein